MSPAVDDATVQTLVRHWNEGWNGANLKTIVAPFADDVVFSSPGISKITGDPSRTTIDGKDALRTYIEDALRRAGEVRYTFARHSRRHGLRRPPLRLRTPERAREAGGRFDARRP